eukprot:Hpha_TRINITY_DN15232_c2_g2::TRINITY_DN15232_c2_g2_i1::g.66517::m.66517
MGDSANTAYRRRTGRGGHRGAHRRGTLLKARGGGGGGSRGLSCLRLDAEGDVDVATHQLVQDLRRGSGGRAVHGGSAPDLLVVWVLPDVLHRFAQVGPPKLEEPVGGLLAEAHRHTGGVLPSEQVPALLLHLPCYLVDVDGPVSAVQRHDRRVRLREYSDPGGARNDLHQLLPRAVEALGDLLVTVLSQHHQRRPRHRHVRSVPRSLNRRGDVQSLAPVAARHVCRLAQLGVTERHHARPLAREPVLVYVNRHRRHSRHREVEPLLEVTRALQEGQKKAPEAVVNVQPHFLLQCQLPQLLDRVHHPVCEGRCGSIYHDRRGSHGGAHCLGAQPKGLLVDGKLDEFDSKVVACLVDRRVGGDTTKDLRIGDPLLTRGVAVAQRGNEDRLRPSAAQQPHCTILMPVHEVQHHGHNLRFVFAEAGEGTGVQAVGGRVHSPRLTVALRQLLVRVVHPSPLPPRRPHIRSLVEQPLLHRDHFFPAESLLRQHQVRLGVPVAQNLRLQLGHFFLEFLLNHPRHARQRSGLCHDGRHQRLQGTLDAIATQPPHHCDEDHEEHHVFHLPQTLALRCCQHRRQYPWHFPLPPPEDSVPNSIKYRN